MFNHEIHGRWRRGAEAGERTRSYRNLDNQSGILLPMPVSTSSLTAMRVFNYPSWGSRQREKPFTSISTSRRKSEKSILLAQASL
jgi:hypothetical protein